MQNTDTQTDPNLTPTSHMLDAVSVHRALNSQLEAFPRPTPNPAPALPLDLTDLNGKPLNVWILRLIETAGVYGFETRIAITDEFGSMNYVMVEAVTADSIPALGGKL
jgi:hypothetical protein